MSSRLRDLIRNVRQCKTASEERGLIQKECASIRQAFKEGKDKYRSRNMLKLLYIAMLGYATEFGQMEVVKLLAQNEYGEKRIGYLTLGILMDETHEVLTLAENHIKKDLGKSNPFVQSLALDVVANIAGEDMSRDVLHEVQQLVGSTNVHLKKKACLAGVRIIRKVPEYTEIFLTQLDNCFLERNHGALLCSLSLVNECLATEFGTEFLTQYRQHITAAVRVLKQLVLSSHAMEHDVNGVADPFLQVKLLQFLRITGKGSDVASEAMNDVLAQVATNTENSKNVGSAILYECVRTMNEINADDGLRLLGINTIGKFLLSSQNNTRFVALSTLLEVMQYDVAAVQRHQSTIIDCLKDPDMSIKRRSLELTIALIDESNVRVLVPDLLTYLDACEDEIKPELVAKLCDVLESKSPTPEWQVQLSLSLFKKGKNFVPEPFAMRFIGLVTARDKSVHTDVVTSLWSELVGSLDATTGTRTAFLTASFWCMGEYTGLLTESGVGAQQQFDMLQKLCNDCDGLSVKLYCMNSIIKFATRNNVFKQHAAAFFGSMSGNVNCEVQQRATEYASLLQGPDTILRAAFSPMPVITANAMPPSQLDMQQVPTAPKSELVAPKQTSIDDIFGGGPVAHPQQQPPQTTPSAVDDIFGGGGPTHPPPSAPKPATSAVDDIFGAAMPAPAPSPPTPSDTSFEAFSCEDFKVRISSTYAGSTVSATMNLLSQVNISGLSFFIAVPRTSTVNVQPLQATSVHPGGSAAQAFSVATPAGQPISLTLRVKVVYNVNGVEKNQLFQVDRKL